MAIRQLNSILWDKDVFKNLITIYYSIAKSFRHVWDRAWELDNRDCEKTTCFENGLLTSELFNKQTRHVMNNIVKEFMEVE